MIAVSSPCVLSFWDWRVLARVVYLPGYWFPCDISGTEATL